MELIWDPSLDPIAMRWQTVAAQVGSLVVNAADTPDRHLLDSGLLKIFSSRRQGGTPTSAVSMVSVLETLATPAAALSVILSSAWIGTVAISRLAGTGQKKAWLGSGLSLPPLALAQSDNPGEPPRFTVTTEAQGWRMVGAGAGVRLAGADVANVIFATPMPARGASKMSAFVAPAGADGIWWAPFSEGAPTLWGHWHADARIDASLMLGPPGGANTVVSECAALGRIAAAALALGASLAAYRMACQGLVAGLPEPSRDALALANCAAALSGARMMLYEAARAADAGQDIRLLSAMTLISANDCARRLIDDRARLVELKHGNPAPDIGATAPIGLLSVLQARQIHQPLAESSQAQTTLLASRLAPLGLPTSLSTAIPPGATQTMSRPSSARSTDATDRVADILDAAADAFTQQSYDNATLDQIGEVLGVSKGSIYYHYPSKADLFAAVYRRAMEMNIETITPIATQAGVPAIDRLYRMAYAHSLQVMKHLSYQRVAVQGFEANLLGRINEAQRARLAEVISLRDRYEELFVTTINEAIAAGQLPEQSARLAVKPLFGAINWTTMWYQPRPNETQVDRDRIAAQLATFVVSGLTQSYQALPVAPSAALSQAE